MDYLSGLNPAQREAVLATDGPVMIIAGAGSGKTRVLTFRIAQIIEKGADSFRIMALTFTNKAATEMRGRIANIIGNEAKNIWMGTFHSVFAKILRVEADRLGYPNNFTIYDTDDAKSLIKTIVKELNLDDTLYKPGLIYNRISAAKNMLMGPEEYMNHPDFQEADRSTNRTRMGEIYAAYVQRCFRAGAMDFDDLLYKTWQLFDRYPEVLNRFQLRFSHILVDEYQDTNYAQYKIVKMLSAVHRNICVVGDDNQSIYAFRGANIQNILGFERDYPDLQTFKLEQNYRSTDTIVSASSSLIAKNKYQLPKAIFTQNQQGEAIHVLRCFDDAEEGKLVAQNIFEEKMRKQLRNSDFAILYRTNAQSRSFEEALRKLNIPYRIYGGMSFYQRKEIKDLLAYIRLIVNQNDEEAFKRVINYPVRGIGKTSIDKLILYADAQQSSLFEAAINANTIPGIGASGLKIKDFTLMIQSFQVLAKQKNAYDLTAWVAKQTGIQSNLYLDKTVEGIARYQNLEELLNGIKAFTEEEREDASLGAYLQEVTLLTNNEEDDDGDADKVSLMSIHASKGLEFNTVFIVGLEENLFPSQLSMSAREELEEERRLLYVAMTRAEHKLFLSFALERFRWGNRISNEPSRFLSEINPNYLKLNDMFRAAPTATKPNDRWGGAFRPNDAQRYPRQPLAKPEPLPSLSLPKNDLAKAVRITPEAEFVADDTSHLQPQMKVEHIKFGVGTVAKVEGKFPDLKATIIFENLGEKQILLKFAKLKIHA